MLFRQLIDSESSTYTYLIADRHTKQAVIVDSVLEQFERDTNLLNELGLNLRYCLDTHIHADHITGAGKLRQATGCLSILPKNSQVKCADSFIQHGQVLQLGAVTIEGISTPGHTNSHMAYLINNTHLLTGDALFIRGCGRNRFSRWGCRNFIRLHYQKIVYPTRRNLSLSRSRLQRMYGVHYCGRKTTKSPIRWKNPR